MINLDYQTTPKEFSQAALNYIEKNSIIAIMLLLMNISCSLALIGFLMQIAGKVNVSSVDSFAALFSIIWILFRRKINREILKYTFKKRKIHKEMVRISVDPNRVTWYTTNNQRQHLAFNKIDKVYTTSKGYIIPKVLYGPLKSTFIWLPKIAFKTLNEENLFLEYLKKNEVNIKHIKLK